jgi:hypothetical protein
MLPERNTTNQGNEARLQLTATQNRDKQRRRRQHLQGNVTVTLMIPRRRAAGFKTAAQQILDNPQLEVAMLRHTLTGKLVSIR